LYCHLPLFTATVVVGVVSGQRRARALPIGFAPVRRSVALSSSADRSSVDTASHLLRSSIHSTQSSANRGRRTFHENKRAKPFELSICEQSTKAHPRIQFTDDNSNTTRRDL
jgi:hypothetical protein